ncbi:MAG: glycosyltransferase family 2 protein [Pseudolabrys sp.]|nr:glycosyltransferase family 2 protein [Pseudolabrys sp.]
MTSAPAISVIVPCYNGGQHLDGLFASLKAQTCQDFEVIVVDDGSTEPATLKKLQDIAAVARVVHQENRYLPGARNTGFREARADLVLPLDCDDRLEPEFLAETLAAIRGADDDVGFVYTHMRLTGTMNRVFATHCSRFDQLFLNHLPYCLLIRKSAWQAVGGYDETMRSGLEDWEFNIGLLRAGYRWIEIPKPLFIYTVRSDGMLLSTSARRQASLWKRIRDKYPELYKLTALVLAWRQSRPGWRSTLRAAILLAVATILPEAWSNWLFFRMNMLSRGLRKLFGVARPAPSSN